MLATMKNLILSAAVILALGGAAQANDAFLEVVVFPGHYETRVERVETPGRWIDQEKVVETPGRYETRYQKFETPGRYETVQRQVWVEGRWVEDCNGNEIAIGGRKVRVEIRIPARRWIPAHYETVCEQVWIAPTCETRPVQVWVPGCREVQVVRVWQPGCPVERTIQVWVPARTQTHARRAPEPCGPGAVVGADRRVVVAPNECGGFVKPASTPVPAYPTGQGHGEGRGQGHGNGNGRGNDHGRRG
jgi:hypothetical protein